MSEHFSFSFSGDDIVDDEEQSSSAAPKANTPAQQHASASAFPVAGRPLLPATSHDLQHMLTQLPSKIAYSILDVDMDGSGKIQLPRRELWDVRVQLMAEDNGADTEPGLGDHDVKTGVYEGGFKSWESSVDLVKVLFGTRFLVDKDFRVIELGCGTALPSLALFQWALGGRSVGSGDNSSALSIILADYNPTVLQLVTLPNFILCWAHHQRAVSPMIDNAFSSEGELELAPEILKAFEDCLSDRHISLSFFSGGWSTEFVDLIDPSNASGVGNSSRRQTVILGAETIYSPFALNAFTQTIFTLMEQERAQGNTAEALVGAKKLYFGVGGSLDDFITKAKGLGAHVQQLREETDGVRRGVVRCHLPQT